MRRNRHIVFLVLIWCGLYSAQAQPLDPLETRVYHTIRASEAPVIDGEISDKVWEQVEWGGGFTQLSPYEGAEPTQDTRYKILYDDNTLYVAYRCFDKEPDKIESRLSRRDGFAGDWIEINIDSYHDKRSAFSFTSSVSGVKSDEYVTEDGNNWDPTWDPVWYLKTQIDSLGWTAEVAIPFSQLRFSKAEEQVWGLQFTRRDFRNESRSVWQYIPRNSGYWVSGFGELRGIRAITPKRQIEIQPYVLGEVATFNAQPGNPFADGSDIRFSAGVDGKIGITNDMSMDFTVNPDFGQVEADPSVLTLDGYQIFFSERRPFFVQNRDLFSYPVSNSNSGQAYDSDNLFYSRRIGANPHHTIHVVPDSGVYVDQPEFTSILGAVKFSGKTHQGLSIGIMEAVTARTNATIHDAGEEYTEAIEPLTNYFVGTLRQDYNEGQTVVGGIVTLVNRDLRDPQLDFLHRNAQTGGLNVQHRWNNSMWKLNAQFVLSRVEGSMEAISGTQTSFEHGFTRPDADHLKYDPNATELIGHGGEIAIRKTGQRFNFHVGSTWRSPKLELNDIGFLRNSDEINHYYWMQYQQTDPFAIFRSAHIAYNHWFRWDFGGQNLYRAFSIGAYGEFKNFWSVRTGVSYDNLDMTNQWLRGGPTYRRAEGMGHSTEILTDTRKVVSARLNIDYGGGFDYLVGGQYVGVTLIIQPSDALNVSVGPSWGHSERIDQYVTTRQFGSDIRYIVGYINQHTLSGTLRVNYNITPDLTLQYYGQPFISRGEYDSFKYVLDPLTDNKEVGLYSYSPQQVATNTNGYTVDENLDGIVDYSFDDPDFNFVQFRSNLVARWEYIPGSEIFLVWTQGNTFNERPGVQGLFNSLAENVFGDNTRNTFLVKMTYRFLNK